MKLTVAVFGGVLGFCLIMAGFVLDMMPPFLSPQRPLDLNRLDQGYDPQASFGFFDNQPVVLPPHLASYLADQSVLGEETSSETNVSIKKTIYVDLYDQKLYAIENDQVKFAFDVSTGKWGRTPTGTFQIWIKLRATLMQGGNKALGTYYYLPNVPYTMFFYNDEVPKHLGFGIHGTYWHDNFGHPMSHGCINMRTEEVEQLYAWAGPNTEGKSMMYASDDNPGTEVVIYGTASEE